MGTPTVHILADRCAIVGAVACAGTTVLNLCPVATLALNLFTEILSAKEFRYFALDISTYHAGSIATAKFPVSIRGLTRTVRASLVTTITGATGVSNLKPRDC